MSHTFHIPVLGLGFSIDTPLKVARYGISSVVSIVDDELVERMREHYAKQHNAPFKPIAKKEDDSRARRITAYLNFLNTEVDKQFEELKKQPFDAGNDIVRYFDLLPDSSLLKTGYLKMVQTNNPEQKNALQETLRNGMVKGAIDVNIMAKVDKMNYDANDEFSGEMNTDALAALRGFAMSELNSSLILSAGMNPRLYAYLESFDDFFPNAGAGMRKKVILKVSDFRSALIQAKFLAKKGIWVSEFRIESGLNCGGHAFATDGLLVGPILDDFKMKRAEMYHELLTMYTAALGNKGLFLTMIPKQRVSFQGGIGTYHEDLFLRDFYQLDATGWGSPFLLVPEATNVDDTTLDKLIHATKDDYYVSDASPLGILFNNFKGSTAEEQRLFRLSKGRPGSPCTKKYLCTNTEFTAIPICTASRKYQHLKLQQLAQAQIPAGDREQQAAAITQKVCLCEGLCASAYIKNGMLKPGENKAVAICPGPNLAYFSKIYSLNEMVGHIYGKLDLLSDVVRPSLFVNELNLYIDHLVKDVSGYMKNVSEKKEKYLHKFKDELQQGIAYYKQLIPNITGQTDEYLNDLRDALFLCEARLNTII